MRNRAAIPVVRSGLPVSSIANTTYGRSCTPDLAGWLARNPTKMGPAFLAAVCAGHPMRRGARGFHFLSLRHRKDEALAVADSVVPSRAKDMKDLNAVFYRTAGDGKSLLGIFLVTGLLKGRAGQ